MKQRIIYFAAILLTFTGCMQEDESKIPFSNVAYIDVAKEQSSVSVIFKKTIDEQQRTFSAVAAYPVGQDISVAFQVNPQAIEVYNAKNESAFTLLDKAHYTLSATQTVIPAGKAQSPDIMVDFIGLKELEIDVTYLLPITLADVSDGLSILNGAKTIYYLVRRSSAITTVANLKDNWIEIPSFDTPAGGECVNGLSAVTYEAIVRVSDFHYGDPNSSIVEKLSTVMGVEQYCLLRIGDTNFNAEQIQFDGSGVGVGKFPEKNGSKLLDPNTWYHLAVTHDTTTGHVCIYVNGKIQSETFVNPTSKPINLAMRALFAKDPATYGEYKSAYQFFIGRSYEDTFRQLCGDISEVRVWSVARTSEEIWDNMYGIDEPQNKPELRAYWKFNEGTGNEITDYSAYGNTAYPHVDLTWNNSVEIPQLNRK